MMNREQQTEYCYLKIAEVWSSMSYCVRKKVGCIIVKNRTIISDGFNGTPSGFPNKCEDDEGKTIPYVMHSESNAILKATKSGISLDGSSMYLTFSPCLNCAKLIIQSGILLVVYIEQHSDRSGIDLLINAGVSVKQKSINYYE